MPSSPPSKPPSEAAPAAAAQYADVVLPVPLEGAFCYAVPEAWRPHLQPGMRITAPWGARQLTGVVTALRAQPPEGLAPERVRALAAVLDTAPLLDGVLLELVRWTAAYYQAPIGEVMRCALPPGGGGAPTGSAPRRRRASMPVAAQSRQLEGTPGAGGCPVPARACPSEAGLPEGGSSPRWPCQPAWTPRARVAALNAAQQAALEAINGPIHGGGERRPLLLHGVTGSGKTAVYLAAMEAALSRGEAALLLVPEIGLTPALFADFSDAFPGQVAVLHSGLTAAERRREWERLRAGEARVALGTRSAVFAPLPRLGLIVVDEEHDASFKQQEAPRYHARDLAVLRARLSGARVVLGSATPSLESFAHARAGKYRLLQLPERVAQRALPVIGLVDMGAEFRAAVAERGARARRAGEEVISKALHAALAQCLQRGQQALVLINRRGFAPVVLCRACGAAVMCRDCALALTYHKSAGRLLCHLCGYSLEPPSRCPACDSQHLYFLGSGSEKVEQTLAALFPQARIARLDRDTARARGHFEQVLARFRAGELDILVGTQMIAKGHDLPGVTLVGVLQADLGLAFPDFRAAERTFQLLTQVAGRAGRGQEPGEVLLQVVHPDHYAVQAAVRADFDAFYDQEANFRRWLHYPPFAAMACARLRHRDYDRVLAYASAAGHFLRDRAAAYPAIRVLGPAPAVVARVKSEYRFQFLFKSESRRALQALLADLRAFARAQKFPATALALDVDPLVL